MVDLSRTTADASPPVGVPPCHRKARVGIPLRGPEGNSERVLGRGAMYARLGR
jgi:hypothetical protein